MWWDADKHPAADKLEEAIDAYRERHGRKPKECLVSEPDGDELSRKPGPMRCKVRREVQRHVFYVGDNR